MAHLIQLSEYWRFRLAEAVVYSLALENRYRSFSVSLLAGSATRARRARPRWSQNNLRFTKGLAFWVSQLICGRLEDVILQKKKKAESRSRMGPVKARLPRAEPSIALLRSAKLSTGCTGIAAVTIAWLRYDTEFRMASWPTGAALFATVLSPCLQKGEDNPCLGLGARNWSFAKV